MSTENLSFQAEVSRLLDIVANSLYSNKEIFLRELISNASDACDRLRYLALSHPELHPEDTPFQVEIRADKTARTLTIADNGIGMNRDDLVANLGTIARSGTAAFVEDLADQKDAVDMIGRFGVGFYSAFMVADEVTVESRKAGEDQAWRWRSDGRGSFTIEDGERTETGTTITLHLKDDAEEYLEPARLRRVVKTYSDHIALPVLLVENGNSERVNAAAALWARAKSEVTEEQYREFYHHVAHAFDDPWLTLHYRAEGVIEYSVLAFVPTQAPFDLFHPDRAHGLKLYVKRVFITDDCADLVPTYLRFVRGVVDCEDLPLNISREMLQHNPVVAKIRAGLVKRILGELEKKAKDAPEAFDRFWESFGAVLKEGLYDEREHRDTLLGLARFAGTHGDGQGDASTTLAGYVERMKEGQNAIYYISADDAETAALSPHLEGFRAKGVEVLYMTDPVDEFWIPTVGSFQDKSFKSVTRGGADLDAIAGEAKEDAPRESEEEAAETGNLDALLAVMRLALKDAVKDVRVSQRLKESPVCLVADEGDPDMHLARVLKQHRQLDETFKRILEINGGHPLVRRMAAAVDGGKSGAQVEELAHLLLDQARILEGEALPEPGRFSQRLTAVFERSLG